MSIEYTALNKETAAGEIKNFLESCPEDAVFRMVINSKRGYLRIKVKNVSRSRFKKLIGRFKIRKSRK